jgi:hypothetical protein
MCADDGSQHRHNATTDLECDTHGAAALWWNLTMRLSDAGLRRRQTELIYPDHRLPPWLTEDATRDRSNRLLDTISLTRDSVPRFSQPTLRQVLGPVVQHRYGKADTKAVHPRTTKVKRNSHR